MSYRENSHNTSDAQSDEHDIGLECACGFCEWALRIRVLPSMLRLVATAIALTTAEAELKPPHQDRPFVPLQTWRTLTRQLTAVGAVQALLDLEKAGFLRVFGITGPVPVVQPILPEAGDRFMQFAEWLDQPWWN